MHRSYTLPLTLCSNRNLDILTGVSAAAAASCTRSWRRTVSCWRSAARSWSACRTAPPSWSPALRCDRNPQTFKLVVVGLSPTILIDDMQMARIRWKPELSNRHRIPLPTAAA